MLELTQEEFAIPLNLERNTISLIENHKRNPSMRTIKDICREFNVNEKWIIAGTGEMFSEPKSFSLDEYIKEKEGTTLEIEIVKTYFELDPEIRKTIINHFKEKFTKPNEISITNDKMYSLPKANYSNVAEAEEKYIKSVLINAQKEESTALNFTEEIKKSI